jgi:hypothetical protein
LVRGECSPFRLQVTVLAAGPVTEATAENCWDPPFTTVTFAGVTVTPITTEPGALPPPPPEGLRQAGNIKLQKTIKKTDTATIPIFLMSGLHFINSVITPSLTQINQRHASIKILFPIRRRVKFQAAKGKNPYSLYIFLIIQSLFFKYTIILPDFESYTKREYSHRPPQVLSGLPEEEYDLIFPDTHLKPKAIDVEIQIGPVKNIGKRLFFYKSKLKWSR